MFDGKPFLFLFLELVSRLVYSKYNIKCNACIWILLFFPSIAYLWFGEVFWGDIVEVLIMFIRFIFILSISNFISRLACQSSSLILKMGNLEKDTLLESRLNASEIIDFSVKYSTEGNMIMEKYAKICKFGIYFLLFFKV